MLKLAHLLRIAAVLALGIASYAAVQPARGKDVVPAAVGMGYSRGGGGGYYGGGYAGGGMSQPYGSAANYYQSPYDSTSQYSGSQQPASTGGPPPVSIIRLPYLLTPTGSISPASKCNCWKRCKSRASNAQCSF